MNHFAEITINYRPLNQNNELPKISSSHCAYRILREHWSDKIFYKEEFVILLLNTANRVIGISKISEGGLSATYVDPKQIFQSALMANASFILLAHNHPSGNLKPSDTDISLTKKLVEVGKFMNLEIYDHLILSDQGYFSFTDSHIF